MKIKSEINKRVNNAVSECRKCIIEATIELLKKIGAEVGDDVLFKKMLIMFQTKPDGTSETIVCDRITYNKRDGSDGYLMVSMGADGDVPYYSSHFMSLSNLQIIFGEVKRVVRNIKR